ncbi:MAG: restriction endonuclease subunit S [Nannocystaceae bacterium]
MKKAPLQEVCHIQIGPFGSLLHKEDYTTGGVPLINPMHIVSGKIQAGEDQTVSEQKAATLSGYRLQQGDVVMGRRGEMGRCAIVSGTEAGMLCGTGSLYLRPDPKRLSSLFLARMLSSESMKRRLENLSQGVTMPNLNRTMIEGLEVLLPPLAEQKRIAGILDAADALRAKRRESLAQLDTLLQSTFLDMFGDPVTNPMGWKIVELVSLVAASDKINYGVVQPGNDFPGGKPLIRVGDFVAGELAIENVKLIDPTIEQKYTRSRLNGRELLISCVGSIGTVCKVPSDAVGFNIARAVARVPFGPGICQEFMLHCLRSEAVQRHFVKETRTVSQPTLNIGLIKNAPVILPPLPLQHRFATIVESVERQKSLQRAHLAELDTLFASLQSRAFRGDL